MNKWVVLAVVLILCVLSIVAFIFWTSETPFEGVIVSISWDYAQNIEQYQAVEHECSGSSCEPVNSYNHWTRSWTTTTFIRSGKTNIPIMTTHHRYRYTINEWVVVATVHQTGQGNSERPYYPQLSISSCADGIEPYGGNSPLLTCQRAGVQMPRHYYQVETDGLNADFMDSCEIGFGRWSELQVGDRVSGLYFNYRNQLDCSSIEFNNEEGGE